jgi:hypothetical protein
VTPSGLTNAPAVPLLGSSIPPVQTSPSNPVAGIGPDDLITVDLLDLIRLSQVSLSGDSLTMISDLSED